MKLKIQMTLNGVIQHVIESGHMQKWARDLDMVRLIHEKIASAQEDDFKPLNLAQFHGAFAFASALLLLASFVFALECLIYWLVIKKRTRLRPLRCLHRRFRQSWLRIRQVRPQSCTWQKKINKIVPIQNKYIQVYIKYFIFSWHIIQFKNTKLQYAVECTSALPLRLLVIIQAVVDVPQWQLTIEKR